MATPAITVQSDPKFSGSGGPVSAEDWLLQLQNSAAAQNKKDEAAIAYYRAHLLGAARTRFGVNGEDFARADWARADVDEPFWAAGFRKGYFRATTQAESVTDWAKIRQESHEGAGDVCARVGEAIVAFWTAVNGERPTKNAPTAAHKASPTAEAAIAVATAEAIKRLERVVRARVLADSIRGDLMKLKSKIQANTDDETVAVKYTDAQKLAWYEALDVHVAEDTAYDRESKDEMEKIFKEEINPVHLLMHYDDLLDTTKRALLLRTLQSAFSIPKCREEAFNFLKHPERDLLDFKVAIKQAESAAEASKSNNPFPKTAHNANRTKINAASVEGGAGSEDTGSDLPDTSAFRNVDPELVEHIAAFYRGDKKGGKKPATGGGRGNSQGDGSGSDKVCNFCKRRGHVITGCRDKKRADKRGNKANNVAAAQPSGN
jgi:hypothetical protein